MDYKLLLDKFMVVSTTLKQYKTLIDCVDAIVSFDELHKYKTLKSLFDLKGNTILLVLLTETDKFRFMCCWRDNSYKSLNYYDSYGINPYDLYINSISKNFFEDVLINTFIHQNVHTEEISVCHCAFRLKFRLMDHKSYNEFLLSFPANSDNTVVMINLYKMMDIKFN